MIVEHSRAIRDARYFAKKRAKVAAAARRHDVIAVDVLHDHNAACCRREPWKTTRAKLMAPAVGLVAHQDPANVEAILAEHEPDVIVLARESDPSEPVR